MKKIISDFKSLNFKHRKVIHFSLLFSIVIFQVLLFTAVYNEFYNESKLTTIANDLKYANRLKKLSETSKDNYSKAQRNLHEFLKTKDVFFFKEYNSNLGDLNSNLDSLATFSKENKQFVAFQNVQHSSNQSKQKLQAVIDSLLQIDIAPNTKLESDLFKLNQFDYSDILNSVNVESSVKVDSVKKKGFFNRLGKAIAGKVDVQKEKLNVLVTMKFGNKVSTGNVQEQLANAFKNTNAYYVKEFDILKKNIANLKNQDAAFIKRNEELLNYSNLLLDSYESTINEFKNVVSKKYDKQYQTNKTIRSFYIFGLIICVVIVSIILFYFTRMAFEYEHRLSKANQIISENLRFKNRIVGMISHEIRSPLSIISIYSKMILSKIKDEGIQNLFSAIQFTTNSLTLLSNQILDFSKNENKKLTLNKKDFNLKLELSEIMKTLATLVENNENKLLVENNIQKQYIAHSDVVKLYQLFYNIIGNANKFTTKGLIKVIIQAVELSPSKINFEVVVEDNGKGISKSDIEHIFDNFYQGIVEEKIHNFGAGLGLNLCKELVELFQGNIHISSDINKGTKVTFNLLFEVRTVE